MAREKVFGEPGWSAWRPAAAGSTGADEFWITVAPSTTVVLSADPDRVRARARTATATADLDDIAPGVGLIPTDRILVGLGSTTQSPHLAGRILYVPADLRSWLEHDRAAAGGKIARAWSSSNPLITEAVRPGILQVALPKPELSRLEAARLVGQASAALGGITEDEAHEIAQAWQRWSRGEAAGELPGRTGGGRADHVGGTADSEAARRQLRNLSVGSAFRLFHRGLDRNSRQPTELTGPSSSSSGLNQAAADWLAFLRNEAPEAQSALSAISDGRARDAIAMEHADRPGRGPTVSARALGPEPAPARAQQAAQDAQPPIESLSQRFTDASLAEAGAVEAHRVSRQALKAALNAAGLFDSEADGLLSNLEAIEPRAGREEYASYRTARLALSRGGASSSAGTLESYFASKAAQEKAMSASYAALVALYQRDEGALARAADTVAKLDLVRQDLLREARRINPDVDLQIVRTMLGEQHPGSSSGVTTPLPRGYDPIKQTLGLALGDLGPKAAKAATYRALWQSLEPLLRPGERAALVERYPVADRRADAFAQWMTNKSQRAGSPFERGFQAVQSVSARIGNLARGRGWTSVDQIFAAAEQGHVHGRQSRARDGLTVPPLRWPADATLEMASTIRASLSNMSSAERRALEVATLAKLDQVDRRLGGIALGTLAPFRPWSVAQARDERESLVLGLTAIAEERQKDAAARVADAATNGVDRESIEQQITSLKAEQADLEAQAHNRWRQSAEVARRLLGLRQSGEIAERAVRRSEIAEELNTLSSIVAAARTAADQQIAPPGPTASAPDIGAAEVKETGSTEVSSAGAPSKPAQPQMDVPAVGPRGDAIAAVNRPSFAPAPPWPAPRPARVGVEPPLAELSPNEIAWRNLNQPPQNSAAGPAAPTSDVASKVAAAAAPSEIGGPALLPRRSEIDLQWLAADYVRERRRAGVLYGALMKQVGGMGETPADAQRKRIAASRLPGWQEYKAAQKVRDELALQCKFEGDRIKPFVNARGVTDAQLAADIAVADRQRERHEVVSRSADQVIGDDNDPGRDGAAPSGLRQEPDSAGPAMVEQVSVSTPTVVELEAPGDLDTAPPAAEQEAPPARPIDLQEWQREYDRQRVEFDEARAEWLSIARRINPSVTLQMTDRLLLGGDAIVASGAADGSPTDVAGLYYYQQRVAMIASGSDRNNVRASVYHELAHSLEEVLSPAEQKILEQAFPADARLAHHEKVAYAFQFWAMAREGRPVKGLWAEIEAAAGRKIDAEAAAARPSTLAAGMAADPIKQLQIISNADDIDRGLGTAFTAMRFILEAGRDQLSSSRRAPLDKVTADKIDSIFESYFSGEMGKRVAALARQDQAAARALDDAREFAASPRFKPQAPAREASAQYLGPERPSDEHVITAETYETAIASGLKGKFDANIAALETLKVVEGDGRSATKEEKEIVGRYVGWGGIPQAFDRHSNTIGAKDRAKLEALLSRDEYEQARRSTINAHYTSQAVVGAIYAAVNRLGFAGGRILDPAIGSGNFVGMMPRELRDQSQVTGVELDPVSARIAKLLYPRTHIRQEAFQQSPFPDGYFDLVATNVPFADVTVADRRYRDEKPALHDYFLLRSLDVVRPGGLVAAVTSRYTLDKADSTIRHALRDRAQLVGAIRLPDSAFRRNAGTEVVTDILFLQRRPERLSHLDERARAAALEGEADWMNLGEIADALGGPALQINQYFADNPEMIAGQVERSAKLYGGYGRDGLRDLNVTLDHEGSGLSPDQHLAATLAKKIVQLPAAIYEPTAFHSASFRAPVLDAPDSVKEGGFYIGEDGQVLRRVDGQGRSVDLTDKEADLVVQAVEVRDALRRVFAAQANGMGDAHRIAARGDLNQAYDLFVAEHGNFRTRSVAKVLATDPDYPLLASLEVEASRDGSQISWAKADVFSRDTITGISRPARAENAAAALGVSLNETGRVDLPRMRELLGLDSIASTIEAAQGLIYVDPQAARWVTASEYLSGDVRAKLETARALAAQDPTLARNVEALEAVQPRDLPYTDVPARLGAAWMPPDVVSAFVADRLGVPSARVDVRFVPALGLWTMDVPATAAKSVASTQVFGTDRRPMTELVSAILNNETIAVYDTYEVDGSTKRVLNEDETVAARQKAEELRDGFKDWVWEDRGRRDRLVRLYNDKFNNIVRPNYDGSHLTFPGLNPEWQHRVRPHQKNAVWRSIVEGRSMYGHEVGTGKTLTFALTAMEFKRLGLAHKPMLAVKKANLTQVADDFRSFYPGARLLVLPDGADAMTRKRVMAQAATGDWDAVIVSHDAMDRLPLLPATEQKLLREQILMLRDALATEEEDRSAGEQPGRRRTVKMIEKAAARLETRLAALADDQRRDSTVYFEDLGVDLVEVDEAHRYKNLAIVTKQQGLKGIPTAESKRAFHLFGIANYLYEVNGNRGLVLGTGTPIGNSVAEVYVWQRMLQPEQLRSRGIEAFDSWCNTFCDVVQRVEMSVSGQYKMTARLARFVAMPELSAITSPIFDVVPASVVPGLRRPAAVMTAVPVQASPEQRLFIAELGARADRLKSAGRAEAGGDNMLKISSDGRKAALDLRLTDAGVGDWANSKVNRMVDLVSRIQMDNPGKTQMVFLDIGIHPKGGADIPVEDEAALLDGSGPAGFSVRHDVIAKLVAAGIPEDRIVDFCEPLSEAQRSEATRRLRTGDAWIGIGSTERLGTGVNAQDRLIGLHHLDAPWLPAYVEQRDGRGIRHGNENQNVYIYRYVTEGSFDVFMWQAIDTKSKFIKQFLAGNCGRELVDHDGAELTPAQVMAVATGNALIMVKVQLEEEVRGLERRARRMAREQAEADAWLRGATVEEEKLLAALPQAQREAGAAAAVRDLDPNELASWPIGEAGERGEMLADRKTAASWLGDRLSAWRLEMLAGADRNSAGYKTGWDWGDVLTIPAASTDGIAGGEFIVSAGGTRRWGSEPSISLDIRHRDVDGTDGPSFTLDLGDRANGSGVMTSLLAAIAKRTDRPRSIESRLAGIAQERPAAQALSAKGFSFGDELARKRAELHRVTRILTLPEADAALVDQLKTQHPDMQWKAAEERALEILDRADTLRASNEQADRERREGLLAEAAAWYKVANGLDPTMQRQEEERRRPIPMPLASASPPEQSATADDVALLSPAVGLQEPEAATLAPPRAVGLVASAEIVQQSRAARPGPGRSAGLPADLGDRTAGDQAGFTDGHELPTAVDSLSTERQPQAAPDRPVANSGHAVDPVGDTRGSGAISVLDRAGLRVDRHQVLGADGPFEAWHVRGNTYAHRELLRALGGRWQRPLQAWAFDADPTPGIQAAIGPKLAEQGHGRQEQAAIGVSRDLELEALQRRIAELEMRLAELVPDHRRLVAAQAIFADVGEKIADQNHNHDSTRTAAALNAAGELDLRGKAMKEMIELPGFTVAEARASKEARAAAAPEFDGLSYNHGWRVDRDHPNAVNLEARYGAQSERGKAAEAAAALEKAGRFYLHVPISLKDEAKAELPGVKFDAGAGQWFLPPGAPDQVKAQAGRWLTTDMKDQAAQEAAAYAAEKAARLAQGIASNVLSDARQTDPKVSTAGVELPAAEVSRQHQAEESAAKPAPTIDNQPDIEDERQQGLLATAAKIEEAIAGGKLTVTQREVQDPYAPAGETRMRREFVIAGETRSFAAELRELGAKFDTRAKAWAMTTNPNALTETAELASLDSTRRFSIDGPDNKLAYRIFDQSVLDDKGKPTLVAFVNQAAGREGQWQLGAVGLADGKLSRGHGPLAAINNAIIDPREPIAVELAAKALDRVGQRAVANELRQERFVAQEMRGKPGHYAVVDRNTLAQIETSDGKRKMAPATVAYLDPDAKGGDKHYMHIPASLGASPLQALENRPFDMADGPAGFRRQLIAAQATSADRTVFPRAPEIADGQTKGSHGQANQAPPSSTDRFRVQPHREKAGNYFVYDTSERDGSGKSKWVGNVVPAREGRGLIVFAVREDRRPIGPLAVIDAKPLPLTQDRLPTSADVARAISAQVEISKAAEKMPIGALSITDDEKLKTSQALSQRSDRDIQTMYAETLQAMVDQRDSNPEAAQRIWNGLEVLEEQRKQRGMIQDPAAKGRDKGSDFSR
ncbi:MAG: N-6 DNA methylase [Aliihoeflea sp.]|uniref:N-6 DNA methylase n=1 Tax=Aliihoeflea sp. TaxID=2608088 RepID=UPI004033BAC5